MAKICIALATYNGEKYLSKMLDSLVMQTRKADLIVAIDDGSKDSTVEILQEYQKTLPLQITALQQNGGHRAAFSKALEIAKTQLNENDLVALADQDDIWLSNKLEVLEKTIETPDEKGFKPVLVFGDAQIINAKGNVIDKSWQKLAHICTMLPIKAHIAGINNVTGCLSLFRAELLDKILPIPEDVTVHDRWVAMIAERNGGIKAIDAAVVQYRLHESNAVGGKPAPAMSKTLEIQVRWLQMIIANSDRLSLSPDEIVFTKHLLSLSQKRMSHGFMPFEIPWIFANRNVLFESVPACALIKKVLFTAIGLPLAKKIWKKS